MTVTVPPGVGGDGAAGAAVVSPAPGRQQQQGEGGSEATQGERILCAAVSVRPPLLCARRGARSSPRLRRRDPGPEAATRPPTRAPCSSTSAAPAATRSRPPTPTARSRSADPGRRAHQRAELQRAQGEPRRTCSSRSATAASRARSCPRTSWSGDDAEKVAEFLPSTPASRRARPQTGERLAVLDLREIRERPARGPGGAAPAAASARPLLDEALELDERRRALLPELEELRARKNEASERIGELQRERRGRGARRSPRCAASSAREKELEEELREVEERRTDALAALPNLPDPTAADEDEVLREVGEARRRRGRDHVELLGEHLDMEAGARVAGLALRLPEGRRWSGSSSRSCSGRSSCWTGKRLHSRDAAGAGARAGAVRHRLPARHRAADLPRARGRALPGGHLRGAAGVAPRGRDPRAAASCRCRYAGFSTCFRREAGAAGKDTHGHLPRAPVRQGRDVHVRRARGVAGRARAAAGDRGGDPPGARDPLPGGEHRGRRPGHLGREEVRPRGVAAGPGPLPRADLVLEHDRLPGAPARRPLPARRTARPPSTCTRSTAPRSR